MSQYVAVECKQGCTARLAVMQTQTGPVRALLHMRCSYRPVCSHSQRLQYYKKSKFEQTAVGKTAYCLVRASTKKRVQQAMDRSCRVR